MSHRQQGNLKISMDFPARSPWTDGQSALLLKIIDGALAGVIFLLPFVMGGRHPLGQLTLALLAVITALAWAIRQCLRPHPVWRPTWALALIFAGIIIVALQSVPLPKPVLELLAPNQAKILPLWNAGKPDSASLGRWCTISLAPYETRANLVLLISYGLLFFVTVQRIKAIEDVERLLRWCATSAACMAVFGLVQYIAGNGKFFWFYTAPFTDTFHEARGSFTNRNHFAHFLALGVGPLIWWLLHASRGIRSRIHVAGAMPALAPIAKNTARVVPPLALGTHESTSRHSHGHGRSTISAMHDKICFSGSARANPTNELKTYILGLVLAIVLFAGMMSLSRGGMAALFLSAIVAAAVCCLASSAAARFLGIMLAACLVIGTALSIFGLDGVGSRLQTLTNGEAVQNEWSGGRLALWTAVASAIPDYFWYGTGAGSFNEVYPIYSHGTLNEFVEYTHAENSYLQVLLETGIIGLGLALVCIILWFSWCMKGWKGSERLKICAGGIAGALAAGTSQALVDFVWYVPACTAIMAILAACAFRVSQFAAPRTIHPKHAPMSRWAAVTAAIVLIPAGVWMIKDRIGPAAAQPYWEQYLIALQASYPEHPLANNANSTAGRNAGHAAVETENELIGCLENVVNWQPTHSAAHLALAEAHLRLFDKLQADAPNPMTLIDIRSAALASEFSSPQALSDWLAQALGNNLMHLKAALHHTRQALSLCPLQGRGYIYLAKIGFLDGKKGLLKQACIAQALEVRPFDGAVFSAAAAEALLDGDTQHWLDLSKHGFRCSRGYQRDLICNLVANVPSEGIQAMIDFIITQFQPDLEGLQSLYDACSKRVGPELLEPLHRFQAQRTEFEAQNQKGPQALKLWLEAQMLHTQLHDGPQALQCARCALECDRNDYRAHNQLASCLLAEGLFAEAEEQVHWCLQRNPDNKSLGVELKQALTGRLEAERCAAAPKKDNL